MKANKHIIFLMYILKMVSLINLSKFVSISLILLKIVLFFFLSFLDFFGLMMLHWPASWSFQRIRTSSYNFCKKCYIWLNIWAKEGKK